MSTEKDLLEKTCMTCRYLAVVKGEQDRTELQCRRHPPTPFVLPRQLLTGVAAPGIGTISVYPPTKPTDGCGEYQRDPQREVEEAPDGSIQVPLPATSGKVMVTPGGSG